MFGKCTIQTRKDFEIIIVNDGSNDKTRNICENYCKEYRNINIINIDNSGVAHARNVGIQNAKGEYITFLDTDDLLHPLFLELVMETVETYKSDMVTVQLFSTYSNEIPQIKLPVENIGYSLYEFLKCELRYTVTGKIFKKSLLLEGFDENLKICEDSKFIIDFVCKLKTDKIYECAQPLYIFKQKIH